MTTQTKWQKWIDKNRSDLKSGAKIPCPKELPHPKDTRGFRRLVFADDVGQIMDWGLPMKDGSRIHIHEFADGTLLAHRDKIDPGRGVISAVAHWAIESQSGPVAPNTFFRTKIKNLLKKRLKRSTENI